MLGTWADVREIRKPNELSFCYVYLQKKEKKKRKEKKKKKHFDKYRFFLTPIVDVQ
jgi:predicted ribosome quality control (RQC) complex YloA/Tae2 family protein